jgi:hypothetical protein
MQLIEPSAAPPKRGRPEPIRETQAIRETHEWLEQVEDMYLRLASELLRAELRERLCLPSVAV